MCIHRFAHLWMYVHFKLLPSHEKCLITARFGLIEMNHSVSCLPQEMAMRKVTRTLFQDDDDDDDMVSPSESCCAFWITEQPVVSKQCLMTHPLHPPLPPAGRSQYERRWQRVQPAEPHRDLRRLWAAVGPLRLLWWGSARGPGGPHLLHGHRRAQTGAARPPPHTRNTRKSS